MISPASSHYIKLMGNQDSNTQDDYFLLQHISKMSLQNRKTVSYYLISSKQDQNINSLLSQLRQYFKIDHFPSLLTLRQEMTFVHKLDVVKVIITESLSAQDMDYLEKQNKIAQIVSYGIAIKGTKMAGSASDLNSLIKLLNSLEQKDALAIPANNLLFLTEQDTKVINKYRLNYHCHTHFNNRLLAKQDFITLARALFPQQGAAINKFELEYDVSLEGEQKRKMVLDWAFRDSFYWDLIDGLTRNTTDPKKLAYLRLPLKDIYEAITEQYQANKLYDSFYIIIELSEQEKVKLETSAQNFMLFTTFVKGMVGAKEANAQLKKRPNAFQFMVNIYRSEKEDKLDFGFVKRSGSDVNILINIYNVFKVENVNLKTRRGELIYGCLPIINKKRQSEQARNLMSKIELDLARNYDFLEDLMGKVDSQATLLQLSGYFKQSLELFDKKVDFIRKTSESDESLNRCLLKKADALTLNGEYDLAEKQYQSVHTKSQKIKVITLIHLAQLYMRIQEEEKLDKIINQLEPLLSLLEKDQKQIQQFYKGRHFLALKSLKKGNYKSAETQLTKLMSNLSTTYTHKFEGKPLVHDIYRTLAACNSKLGNHAAALKLLNQTRSLQLACQGKTHNLARTETLIQTISRTAGNKEELAKSMQRLQAMSTDIDSRQGRLDSSAIVSLNQSMVRINI